MIFDQSVSHAPKWLTINDLYSKMLANGYKNGTPVSIFGCRAGIGDNSFALRLSKLTGGYVGGGNADLWGGLDGSPAIFANEKTIPYPNASGRKDVSDYSTPGFMRWFKNGQEFKSPNYQPHLGVNHRYGGQHRNFGMDRSWTSSLPNWLKK